MKSYAGEDYNNHNISNKSKIIQVYAKGVNKNH